MIRRILKIVGLTLLLLVVVLIGGISWVIGTETGFQQTLAMAKKFAPGTLVWDEASGKLAGPLRIRGLRYSQVDSIEATVGALNFDWRPSALVGAELAVDQLHLEDIEVYLAEGAEVETEDQTTAAIELPDISLPVSINLNDVVINNVSIFPAGQDTPIEIERLALKADVERSDINVEFFDISAPQGELSVAGDMRTHDDYPMNLTLRWQADIGQATPVQGEGTVSGSLAQLQIDHQISGFATADIVASVSNVTQLPQWEASIGAGLSDPEALSTTLTGKPEFTLQTSGTLDDYQAKVKLSIATTETGPVSIDADISGSTQMLDIRSLVAKLDEHASEVALQGQIVLATRASDFQGQWQDLNWPMEGDPQFTSASGLFSVKGSPERFTLNAETDVEGEALPKGQWTVLLDGSQTALNQFALQGQTLEGTIKASGAANWERQPEWDVDIVTQGINPGNHWAEFPGNINLELSSTGQISDAGPQLNAAIKSLSGSLRQQPLSGSGLIRLAGEKLTIDQLNLTHGTTELEANGEVDQQIAMDFELSSPDLRTLLPDLAGSVSVSGAVSGSKQAPILNASGNADNAVYAGNSIGKLDFNVVAGLATDAESNLSIDASGIAAGSTQISDVSLRAQGSQADHSVVLSAATNQGNIDTQLAGSYQAGNWDGNLSSLSLVETLADDWQLSKPVPISANADKAKLSELCLNNSNDFGSVCVSADWLAVGESLLVANIKGLSPELVSAYLPPGLGLNTKLNGDATAVLDSDGVLDAQASIELEPGKLMLESDSSPIEIGLERTTIDASMRGTDATLELTTAFTDFGDLNLQASVSDPSGVGKLAGSLNADFPDLTLISAFAPQVQQVSGTLKSNLSFGGNLESPEIEGELALYDFNAEIPETAMVIKDTQLTLQGKPDGTLLLSGESRSGDGQLAVDGRINPRTRALTLDISGNEYEVAGTALMQAVISPQLTIAMDDSSMKVNGTVTIPTAYINANGGNEGIKTINSSSDVVFVSEEGDEAEVPPSQLNVDVQIVLGDSVELEAGDFRGRLEGDLRVEQTPELAPRGTGTINVLNGDYVIYGQQLNMERGRILFSGGPVDNPSLDMEVARNVQEYDVVAGARIQGTVQAPRLELYSEPSMPDASILSFILLGQPPGSTGASYTLGKYLTPDLYVSYGIGLFDAINTFNMRYKLTDRLALEAASGSGSSADLIFTIEK